MKQKKSQSSVFSDGILTMIKKAPAHYSMDVMAPLIEQAQLGMQARLWLEDNPIDDAVSAEYRKLVRKGEIALEKAVTSNARLVASYVLKIVSRRRGHGLDASGDDLFQCGCIGLQTAVVKFDLTRGLRFSTYATHWVKQGIDRELMNFNDNSQVRVPVHIHRFMHKAALLSKERASLGLPALSDNDMCDLVNKTYRDEGSTLPNCSYESFTAAHQIASARAVDGNSPIGEDGSNFFEMLACEYSDYMTTDRLDAIKDIEGMFGLMKEKEAFVLRQRFLEELTLDETGKLLGVTRERVRQIQDGAVKKLTAYVNGDETAFMSVVQKRHLAKAKAEGVHADTIRKTTAAVHVLKGTCLKVYTMHESGIKVAVIAKALGIKGAKVYYELKKAKAKIAKAKEEDGQAPQKRLKDTEKVLDGITLQIYELRAEGKKAKEIMALLDITQHKISYEVKKANALLVGLKQPIRKKAKKAKMRKATPKPAKRNRCRTDELAVERVTPFMMRVNGVMMGDAMYRTLISFRKNPKTSVPVRSKELKMSMNAVHANHSALVGLKLI